MRQPILHIISEADWLRAKTASSYEPPSLAAEGFIHCSRLEQVAATASRHFPGRTDLLLLVIDPDRIECKIRDEDLSGRGETFPHIYGPLNLDAVEFVIGLTIGADGRFRTPFGPIGSILNP